MTSGRLRHQPYKLGRCPGGSRVLWAALQASFGGSYMGNRISSPQSMGPNLRWLHEMGLKPWQRGQTTPLQYGVGGPQISDRRSSSESTGAEIS